MNLAGGCIVGRRERAWCTRAAGGIVGRSRAGSESLSFEAGVGRIDLAVHGAGVLVVALQAGLAFSAQSSTLGAPGGVRG